ncbi:EPT/RTPC-like protein [Microthyrium microscopicum]|uniref:EPT/RTPC-like protein n=1 Tax=Microthyrium microscopicum TaxID=703497 RepID=A0A6A6UM46_9PEZI|nr:EPT/RTPC-like protein [Microthyrium microscopicum]
MMPRIKPLHIPGTHLEGGGQLLRLAMGLGALTHTPLHITSIRGNRGGGGGLKLQHLRAVEWLAEACSADLEGASRSSKTLTFTPQPIPPTQAAADRTKLRSEIDIGSPGSVALVFQAILPYLLFGGALHALQQPNRAAIKVTISGGTNVSKSPSFEYIQHVLLPTLAKIGLPTITATLQKRGWSTGRPQMGSVEFKVTPLPFGEPLSPWSLVERGDVQRVEAYALVPRQCRRQMEHELAQQKGYFKTRLGAEETEVTVEDSGHEKRFYLLLVAVTENGHRLGRDWLYDQKNNLKNLDAIPRKLVDRVTEELEMEIGHGGCVDEYMRDQLVVFEALADGPCEIDVGRDEAGKQIEGSLHTQTAKWIAKQVLGKEP